METENKEGMHRDSGYSWRQSWRKRGEDIYFGTSGGNVSVGLALLADCPPNVRTALVPHEGDFLSARVPTRGPTYNNPRLPRPGIGRRYDPAARPRT